MIPAASSDFVAHMEDVLSVYKRPHNPKYPVVCMDEQPVQLIKETRIALPCGKGLPFRFDYEYERNGTANNFMFTSPLADWRRVSVRERKTALDWADEIKRLADEDFPEAERIDPAWENRTAG